MMYFFGEREKGMLVPAFILSGIATLFMISRSGFWRYWPVALIILGLVMIFRNRMNKEIKSEEGEDN